MHKYLVVLSSVSVMIMFFCIVKSIMALIKYFSWSRSSIRTTGKIIDITKRLNAYGKKKSQTTQYVYEVELNSDDDDVDEKPHIKFIENTSSDKPSKFDLDNYIDVFYRQESNEVASIEMMKNDCFEWILGIFICIAIIIASFWIRLRN